MKNRVLLLLVVFLFITNAVVYGADQWIKGEPEGDSSPSDIDTLIETNNESLDRLVYNYRRDCMLIPDSSTQFTVNAGELAIPNSAGTVVRWRRNTSATTVTWSDIDQGAEASSTQYYVYAVADADATTFTVNISTSSTAPDSATYYRKIGYFYNNSSGDSGDIVNVGNIKGGDVGNIIEVTGTSDISTSLSSMTDMTDMEVKFISSGRPVYILFSAPIYTRDVEASVEIYVDGVTATTTYSSHHDGSTGNEVTVFPFCLTYLDTTLSSGVHTIKVRWSASGGTAYQYGTTQGERVLTIMEM